MSNQQQSVQQLDSAPSYNSLRAKFIGAIETFSSKQWTDYNTHDPGITIGEHLCFGITEALHASNLPIADLLAANPESPDTYLDSHYEAKDILTIRPVTVLDFRKIIIDMPGVKNAWLTETFDSEAELWVNRENMRLTRTPPPNQPEEKLVLRGFYHTRIEFEPHLSNSEQQALLRDIRSLLESNRNLCEVFLHIEKVLEEEIGLCIDLEITNESDPENVMANALHALEQFIAPSIVFHTLAEQVKSELSSEDIFNGPLLAHGFIDDEELLATEPKDNLRASDLVQELMNVPGIVAVKSLVMTSYQDDVAIESGQRWSLPLNTMRAAKLEISKSRINLYKGRLPIHANADDYLQQLADLRASQRFNRNTKWKNLLEYKSGDYRNIADFETLQNEFPLNYGIGQAGLAPSETNLRKSQASQLKAYLLALETYLSSYVFQIVNLRSLFSLKTVTPTLFGKSPTSIKDLESLSGNLSEEAFNQKLQEEIETPSENIKRRNCFLDHLLGRFAESFDEYTLVASQLYGDNAAQQLVQDKISWLQNYPELSSKRFGAFDTQGESRDFWNVSGLEKRLMTLLGVTRKLADCVEFYEEKDNDDIVEFRFRIRDVDNGILLSSTVNYPSIEKAYSELYQVVASASSLERYDIRRARSGKFYFVLLNEDYEVIAMRKDYYDTNNQAISKAKSLVAFFRDKIESETIHLLEHIQIRPDLGPVELLPICDPETKERVPFSVDPYSFRISVLLPAWAPRFQDTPFRRFVERLVREQTPAHIFPKICWVSREQMDAFERAYYPWRIAQANDSSELSLRRNQLILVLQSLRSQFPQATLHNCKSSDLGNPVVLDNNILGTLLPPPPIDES